MLYDFIQERMCQFSNQIISDETRKFTYSEFVSATECFSRGLILPKYGVLCKSELNTALGVFACIKAGVTAVPLSARYGEVHVNQIIQHMNISHIITDENGVLEVKKMSELIDETEDLIDVALIMCTSGTTGKPKGAMITYENLIANLQDIERYFKINDSDTILIARPIYHCAVLTGEFFISLCCGLNIRFYNGEFSPFRLIQEISDSQVTVLGGTPTLFYHLCQMIGRSKMKLPLRVIAVSGECMTESVADTMRKTLPDTDIYSVYGLTEASPRVSALPPEQFDKYPLSVGFHLQSVAIKIENSELLIKGKTIMKGYYNEPTQTSKVLNDNWLHTGDSAVMDGEGRITVKGRIDNMIIRAGMNIFPQEIENALKSHSRIFEVLAYGEQKDVTQKICVKVKTDCLNKADIMGICQKHLPAYAIPDEVEIVDFIPRNASGKLIRTKI